MDELLLRALIAGGLLSLVTGPLGSVMIWRRWAYFGETMAHAALLGVALALLFKQHIMVGLVGVTVLAALALGPLIGFRRLYADSWLGILAHASLAAGLLVFSFTPGAWVDLAAWLAGDLLLIGWSDLQWIAGLCCIVLALIMIQWRKLVMSSLHEETARVEGIRTDRLNRLLLVAMAVVIAVGIQLVGVLLIIAMMLIPAASARFLASTPTQMAVLASLIGLLSVGTGLWGAVQLDAPVGPSIVVAATGFFILSLLRVALRRN